MTTALFATFAILWVAWFYEPVRRIPFEMVDVGEFMPILRGSDTFAAGFAGLLEYYGAHGRFNPTTFLALSARWEAFGLDPLGWRASEIALMLVITASAFALLRRLGTSALGAAAGAATFLFARTAVPLWHKVHVGEPLGLLLAMGALALVLRLHEARRWLSLALGAALLLVGASLAKETLLAWVPFVLVVAACTDESRRWRAPRLSARVLGFAVTVGAVVVAFAIVPILLTLHLASADGYAASYGETVSSAAVGSTVVHLFLPLADGFGSPGVVATLALLLAGALAARREVRSASQAAIASAVALVLPLVATLLYLPWPTFVAFYGLPFLFGFAMLVGVAVTAVERTGASPQRWVALLSCLALVVLGAKRVLWQQRSFVATQEVASELTSRIEASGPGSEIVLLVRERDRWRADLIERYGRATLSRPLPPIREMSCDDASDAIRGSAGMIVTFVSDCPGPEYLPDPSTILRRYTYLAGNFRPVTDSVAVLLWTRSRRPDR